MRTKDLREQHGADSGHFLSNEHVGISSARTTLPALRRAAAPKAKTVERILLASDVDKIKNESDVAQLSNEPTRTTMKRVDGWILVTGAGRGSGIVKY